MVYCIYKIVCNDINITDCYVGSTLAFRKRKWEHKCTCNNETNKNYNSKIYQIIRANGGWENWRMVIIEEMSEETTKTQAHIREEYFRVELQATLNIRSCGTGIICGLTKQVYDKQYQKTDKYKEYQKQYQKTDKHKEYQKEYQKEYYNQKKERLAMAAEDINII
jgi:hypothetical protein